MNDLQIVINETPAVINDNFEQVRESLSAMMQAYEGLTYTDDTVKDARTDIATLRKIRKAIDDKRKEVKKAHMIPYEEFEAKAKELCEIIDNAITPIDKQIEDYAERKRQERKEAIKEYFESKIGDVDCLTFDDVFLPAWISNMSTTMKLIKSVIDDRILSVKADLDSIDQTESEVKDKALEMYKKTKRLADAIKVINDYEQQKREILAREEARKKAEEERRRQEEERRIKEEEQRKAREEAARIAEEERKKREEERKKKEEEDRRQKEIQDQIEKAKAEERARIEREMAEKAQREQPKHQASTAYVEPFVNPFASSEPTNNPFGQASEKEEPLPFDNTPFAEACEKALQEEQSEPLTGEVEPFATSQQEPLRNVLMRFKATDSQIRDIEQYLLSINVSFIKQVM